MAELTVDLLNKRARASYNMDYTFLTDTCICRIRHQHDKQEQQRDKPCHKWINIGLLGSYRKTFGKAQAIIVYTEYQRNYVSIVVYLYV